MNAVRVLVVSLSLLVPAGLATAQSLNLSGQDVPAPSTAATSLPLTLADAIHRGLEYNLAIIVSETRVGAARSARLQALSGLLPHVSADANHTTQVLNTAAFGFSGFGGLPSLIGPFNVFDARVNISAPLVDVAALRGIRAERARTTAAEADRDDVRETVVLAVGNLYLRALSDRARVTAARAEVSTAEALAGLASDQQTAGLVARVDVIRQQVQVTAARARLITAENMLAKRKLDLARAIGLPADQPFELADPAMYSAAPAFSIDALVTEAALHRPDLRASRARVDAAQAEKQAASAERLPSLHFDANLGALGPSVSTAERTFAIGATVRMPVFQGGATRAHMQRADAELQQREAELRDAEAGVRYQLSAALLDLNAASAAVDVAQSGNALAGEELTQAQDRFRAGVASSIELVQAQDAVARANEQYIASVYAHNIAKANIARALGEVEERFLDLIGGVR